MINIKKEKYSINKNLSSVHKIVNNEIIWNSGDGKPKSSKYLDEICQKEGAKNYKILEKKIYK